MVYILTVITVKQHLAVHKFLSAELRTCRAAVLHISAALERERERGRLLPGELLLLAAAASRCRAVEREGEVKTRLTR